MQQLSVHDHRPTILFGANLITAAGRVRRGLPDRPSAVPAVPAVSQRAQPDRPAAARPLLHQPRHLCATRRRRRLLGFRQHVPVHGGVRRGAAAAARRRAWGGTSCAARCATSRRHRSRAPPSGWAARWRSPIRAVSSSCGRGGRTVEVPCRWRNSSCPGVGRVVTAPTESWLSRKIARTASRSSSGELSPPQPPLCRPRPRPAADTVPAPTADTLYRFILEVPPPPAGDARPGCPTPGRVSARPAGGTVMPPAARRCSRPRRRYVGLPP